MVFEGGSIHVDGEGKSYIVIIFHVEGTFFHVDVRTSKSITIT